MRHGLIAAVAGIALLMPPAVGQAAKASADPLEALAGRGGEAIRLELISGYGGSFGTLTLWKRNGRPARLQFYNPANHRMLEGELGDKAWQALQSEASQAASRVARGESDENDEICLHPAAAGVTFVDRSGASHQFDADVCNGGPAISLADDAMHAAFDVVPQCKWLSPEEGYQIVLRLQACTLLKGNLRSAGEALNWLEGQKFKIGQDWAHWALEGLLNDKVVAGWGQRPEMHHRDTIKAAIYEDFLDSELRINWVRGVNAQRAVVELLVITPPKEDDGKEQRMTLNLTLIRTAKGTYELVRIAPR